MHSTFECFSHSGSDSRPSPASPFYQVLLIPKDVCKIVGDDRSSLRLLVVVGGKWEEALDLNQTNCPSGHLTSSLNGLNRKWWGVGVG